MLTSLAPVMNASLVWICIIKATAKSAIKPNPTTTMKRGGCPLVRRAVPGVVAAVALTVLSLMLCLFCVASVNGKVVYEVFMSENGNEEGINGVAIPFHDHKAQTLCRGPVIDEDYLIALGKPAANTVEQHLQALHVHKSKVNALILAGKLLCLSCWEDDRVERVGNQIHGCVHVRSFLARLIWPARFNALRCCLSRSVTMGGARGIAAPGAPVGRCVLSPPSKVRISRHTYL